MYVTCSKSKNVTLYYLVKFYRDNTSNKVCSKVVEKIGSKGRNSKKIGKSQNIDEWLKNYAKKKRRKKKEKRLILYH